MKMKRLSFILALPLVLLLGACASDPNDGQVSRWISLSEGRVSSTEITAPAGRTVDLAIDLIGGADAKIAVPSAGVQPTLIPASRFYQPIRGFAGRQATRHHILIGPLDPGQYDIQWEYKGKTLNTALIIIEDGAQKKAINNGSLESK